MDCISLMLIDKSYFDYDYEEPKGAKERWTTDATDEKKLNSKLARLGFGQTAKPSPEEIQKSIIEDLNKRKTSSNNGTDSTPNSPA